MFFMNVPHFDYPIHFDSTKGKKTDAGYENTDGSVGVSHSTIHGTKLGLTGDELDHYIKVRTKGTECALLVKLEDDGAPLSFLSVPGAKDVGVEVHSLSKGFDMIGWRIGWVCGHARIVSAFSDVKDNCDSGQFIAIQKAAATALRDPSIPADINAKYKRRLEKLVSMLQRCGIECTMPGGSYFLYCKVLAESKMGLNSQTPRLPANT